MDNHYFRADKDLGPGRKAVHGTEYIEEGLLFPFRTQPGEGGLHRPVKMGTIQPMSPRKRPLLI